MPSSGLVAHTLTSRFADHLPYYRQEAINARSGVHTARSTLAAWAGQAGAALEPMYDAPKRFVLACAVLHADETRGGDAGSGSGQDPESLHLGLCAGGTRCPSGAICEFCLGRGSQYPAAFLGGTTGPPRPVSRDDELWSGTLVCDQYAAYDRALERRVYPQRIAAGCVVHARRKFDELANNGVRAVAVEAIRRIGSIYHVEGQWLYAVPCGT